MSGAETPLLARLLAVAAACDAMLSPRPYRAAMPINKMEAILVQGAGSQWDAGIVDHFMDCRDDIYSICFDGAGEMITSAVERAAQVTDTEWTLPAAAATQLCRPIRLTPHERSRWGIYWPASDGWGPSAPSAY